MACAGQWWEGGGEHREAPIFPCQTFAFKDREMQMSITGKVTYSQRAAYNHRLRKYNACEGCGHLRLVFTPVLQRISIASKKPF